MSEFAVVPEIIDPERPASRRGWWGGDFIFSGGRVKVHDTGADLALDRTLINEFRIWLGYHLVIRARSWWVGLLRPNAPKLWFSPCRPRPWYLVWSAMAWSGLRFARSPQEADAVFAFEDATWSRRETPGAKLAFNAGLLDISKSHVARIFEAAFGYPLAVDPTTWAGPAVEKSEVNGRHDGRVVQCPMTPRAGCHYQRLIETGDEVLAHDLRTACIGGTVACVWIKTKPAAERFSIHNRSVTLHEPTAVFSGEELASIGRFLSLMQADWAGLDILRDRHDGRLYIVDVNKTDVGPLIALSFTDKIRSTRLLSRALEAMLAVTILV